MAGGSAQIIDGAATVSGWFMPDRTRYFSDVEGARPIGDQLGDVTLPAPDLTREGVVQELRAELPSGPVDPAVMVHTWVGADRPTIVIHHGNNERPFAFGASAKNSLGKALATPPAPGVNLVLVRAPFHAGTLRGYLGEVRRLDRFAALLATSVQTVEAVVHALKKRGSGPVAITGISLGGWVTNLHRAFHGSAELYVPVFAGAALSDVFLATPYRRMTSRAALTRPQEVQRVLDFETQFSAVDAADVKPLLARHDAYIRFERQRPIYGDRHVAVLDKGHITGSLSAKALRAHVLDAVDSVSKEP